MPLSHRQGSEKNLVRASSWIFWVFLMFSDSIVALHGHCHRRCRESSILWLHLNHIGSCSGLDSCILYAVQMAPVRIVSSVHLNA